MKRLADPAVRQRLKREIDTGSPGWWNIIEAAGGWDGIVLANASNPANARFEGKNLTTIAREMGRDPADAAFDLVAASEGRVMATFHMMSEPDIEMALRFPWTSIGSDAGSALAPGQPDAIGLPHPRAYGNFPRVIARYVRERQALTLPEAIDGSPYEGDPKDNTSYRAYGHEALAVAAGTVSAIKDGIPENVPGPTSRAVPITLETVGGNHVIVNLGDGVYAFYAHLQPGSIKVKLGDRVQQGQVLGLVGNTGNSTEPHLHFHLSDANSPLGCEGLPYALTAFEIEGRIGGVGGGALPAWQPLATPEARKQEMPLENSIVRFPDR
jgi:hypothetical protein